ncbi:MAG: 23S rRNA methylase [uncultured bacterium]|nr:MAG: 23S rRNA methylase [uncultured bacterium]
MLDFHVDHLDPPGIGSFVDDLLDIGIQLFPLRQHLVQIVLAEDRAQGGLGKLIGRIEEMLDLDDRLFRIDHPEIEHRIDPHRDVIPGDHILGRDIQGHHPQIDPEGALNTGHDNSQAGHFHPLKPAEKEDHQSLILGHNFERERYQPDQQSHQRHILQQGNRDHISYPP